MRKLSMAMVGEDIEPPWADGVVNTVKNWSEGLSKHEVDVEVPSAASKRISTTCLNEVTYRYLCALPYLFIIAISYLTFATQSILGKKG